MIFIGSVYPDHIYSQNISQGHHIDFAAHTFQTSLLEGLSAVYDNIQVITSPVTSTYPRSRKLSYKASEGILTINNVKDIDIPFKQISFLNLPVLKLISEFFQVRRVLKKALKNDGTVYIYALHSPFLLAAYSLRAKIRKICIIVPDLPKHMSHNNGILRKILKRINGGIIDKCLRQFDNYVLFSRMMELKLPIKHKNSIIVEGIFAPTKTTYTEKDIKKTFLYSGIINKKYGVFDLIEAFHRIQGDEYQLLLCGSCPSERDELDQYLIHDPRIQYLGMLSKEEVRILQASSTVVINPRHSTDEYTKYSFPSKTMEYMASGTPTLMCRLPAIPNDYNEHLFFFEDESITGYQSKMEEICNMDPDHLSIFGHNAKQFILKNKNCYSQAKRIYDMVENKSFNNSCINNQ